MAELENYFNKAGDNLQSLRSQPGCTNKTGVRSGFEEGDRGHLKDQAEGINGAQRVDGGKGDKQDKMEKRGRQEETERCNQRDESLKLSIVETQPEESPDHSASSST